MVSVIIPVYNKEQYLERCLDSVLSQTFRDLEVLLIDDGSTDQSASICESYARKDPRVRVIRRENGGASAARNTGIEEAQGEYIGFVDADDWIEAEMYAMLVHCFEEADGGSEVSEAAPGVVQLMSRDYAPDGTMITPPRREDGRIETISDDHFFRELMMHIGDSSFCTKLFRAPFLKEYRFAEGKKNEDFELLLRMLPQLGAGIPTIGYVGYNIWHSEESATRGSYRQKLYEDMMYNAFTAYRIALNRYPEYMREALRFRLVQALDFLLHIPIAEMTKENRFYMRIVRFVRSERREIAKNRFLSPKQRRSLKLLAFSPRLVRTLHYRWMKLKGVV